MLVVTLVMLVIVVLAALVVTYVAYPHRGEEVPAAPWLGDAMARAVDAAPTLPSEEEHRDEVRYELPDEAGDARRAG